MRKAVRWLAVGALASFVGAVIAYDTPYMDQFSVAFSLLAIVVCLVVAFQGCDNEPDGKSHKQDA